jgi:type I restriction enzyme S subunit
VKKGWKQITFGELGRVFNGNSISESEKKAHFEGLDEGVPYIGTKDVSFDHEIEYESGVKIPDGKQNGFKLAPPNVVFVCAEGGSAGKKIAHNDRDVYFGNKLFAICPKPPTSSRFVFYFCLSGDFAQSFKGAMSGLIGGVSLNKFKDLSISLPSVSEQQRIVGILDEAFEGIATAKANAEKNLQNARAIFESHLQSVFTQRGAGWKQKTLEEIAMIFGRGKSKHRPRNAPHLYGGKYPFVQTGDIRNADHIITDYSQTYSEAGLAQSKLWPKGTICITIAANIAETAILGFDACFPDSVIGVVANPKEADVGFIEYLLQSFKASIQAMGKGSAQANINMGTFENERFPFPPVAEQKRLVAQLDDLCEETQRLTGLYERKIVALEALKKSLLHQAFSGEL